LHNDGCRGRGLSLAHPTDGGRSTASVIKIFVQTFYRRCEIACAIALLVAGISNAQGRAYAGLTFHLSARSSRILEMNQIRKRFPAVVALLLLVRLIFNDSNRAAPKSGKTFSAES